MYRLAGSPAIRAVAARENASKPPPIVNDTAPPAVSKAKPAAPIQTLKKDPKKSLKGVLVKKKAKPATSSESKKDTGKSSEKAPVAKPQSKTDKDEEPQAKRRKLTGPES